MGETQTTDSLDISFWLENVANAVPSPQSVPEAASAGLGGRFSVTLMVDRPSAVPANDGPLRCLGVRDRTKLLIPARRASE
jgi:hypothetical protein